MLLLDPARTDLYSVGAFTRVGGSAQSRASRSLAAKLEAEPGLLDVARSNLRRWLQDRAEPALDEWRDLIARTPLDGIVTLLRSSTPTAARLPQSSPFAGILTPEERQAILNRYEPRRA
jgi:hypothetical protein